MVFCPGSIPAISAEILPATAVPGLPGSAGAGANLLRLRISGPEGGTLRVPPEILGHCELDLGNGLDPVSEISLLALALRLSGGHVRSGERSGAIELLLPCWS